MRICPDFSYYSSSNELIKLFAEWSYSHGRIVKHFIISLSKHFPCFYLLSFDKLKYNSAHFVWVNFFEKNFSLCSVNLNSIMSQFAITIFLKFLFFFCRLICLAKIFWTILIQMIKHFLNNNWYRRIWKRYSKINWMKMANQELERKRRKQKSIENWRKISDISQ